tara:strand:+ start:11086 stop:11385 length:300 start_codon:yes stop_codon:yes gene_type:complete
MKKVIMHLKFLFISVLILTLNFELNSQGCSMCKSIVQSEISAGNEGISSGINFGIIYLFTSTYFLLIAGGLLWYFRSKKDQKNLEIRNKISERVASIHN